MLRTDLHIPRCVWLLWDLEVSMRFPYCVKLFRQ